MKNPAEGFNSRLRWQKKWSVKLKLDQKELCKLKNREKNNDLKNVKNGSSNECSPLSFNRVQL